MLRLFKGINIMVGVIIPGLLRSKNKKTIKKSHVCKENHAMPVGNKTDIIFFVEINREKHLFLVLNVTQYASPKKGHMQ